MDHRRIKMETPLVILNIDSDKIKSSSQKKSLIANHLHHKKKEGNKCVDSGGPRMFREVNGHICTKTKGKKKGMCADVVCGKLARVDRLAASKRVLLFTEILAQAAQKLAEAVVDAVDAT
jgi:hypothetical protein